MRVAVSIILTAVLTLQMSAQEPAVNSSIQQEISTIPSDSLVQVNLKAGNSIRGRIVSRTDTGFSLQREKGNRTQTIAYDQVLSVSQVRHGHSHKQWIILGVAVGAAVIVVVIIVAVVKTNGPFAL